MKSKRKYFLEHYFKIFEVEDIEWKNESVESIEGTLIYDYNDIEERQDIIWYKTEDEVPSSNVIILINKLFSDKLVNGDKLIKPINEIELSGFDNLTKEKMFEDLFDICVNMVDNGVETDIFFLHD